MALIDIRDLTFAYPGSYDNVFEHLSLQLDTHWRLGLVGRNGRGKTTLLRLLQRQYEYDGAISVPVPLDCFPSPVSAPERDTLTILEEQEPGLELWRIYKELDTLEVDAGGPVPPLLLPPPAASRSRCSWPPFFSVRGFLLLDEPTTIWIWRAAGSEPLSLPAKAGFLLVSHDRVFLDGCVDHIMVINKRDIEVRQGSFSAWWRDKQARDDWERAENARLKQEIGRLEDAARRTASWSDRVEAAKKGCRNSGLRPDRGYLGHKAQKMMRRSKAVEARRTEAAEAKAGLLKNIELAEALKLRPLEHPQALSAGGQGVCARLRGGPRVPSCLLHRGAGGTGGSGGAERLWKVQPAPAGAG